MAKLLHILSSPRGHHSASNRVAKGFIDSYQVVHPEDKIETLDVWDAKLPEFDGSTLDAKYAVLNEQPHSPEQRNAWQAVINIGEHFKSADKFIFSLPMWNFNVPYKLKHYIDILAQPGLTFSFSPTEGYKGLITGKPVLVVYARGGAYGPGSGAERYDLQKTYLRQLLGFIGFASIEEIFVEPTLTSANAKDEAIAIGIRKAQEIALHF
jgi:FMN-dependent NADH-azoreductase